MLVSRAGEIRGVDIDEPQVHIIPTVSGPLLTMPSSVQFLAAEYAIFWVDTEVSNVTFIIRY